MAYIGIDLGGTKVAGALFDAQGNILFETTTLLDGKRGGEVGELITEICRTLYTESQCNEISKLKIGVSIPGISYSKSGTVWAPNIPDWENYPLKDELIKAFPGSKVTIESDRTCYILGEALRGAAVNSQNAIFIAVGTGIGAGILIDGRILHGHSDITGATGWMALQPPYRDEYNECGCFETHASGNGIASQANKYLLNNPFEDSLLRNYDSGKVTSYEVFDAYERGDKIASQIIDKAVEMWGMAAANFVSLFNPEFIIFGGGVFGPASSLVDKIYREALKWAQPISIRECKFTTSQLGSKAGLYGAGAIAVNNY